MARLGNVQRPCRTSIPPRLVPKLTVLAIASLTLAGVAAGLYPARKARVSSQ